MTEALLHRLRAQGLEQRDPARFYYLQCLQQRTQEQHGAVRARLQQRLDEALASSLAQPAPPATGPAPADTAQASARPLAALNAALARRQASGPQGSPPESTAPTRAELHSVRRFGETWAKVAVEQQLLEALANAPSNAGPLNSQRLVLRALTRMRALSPDYLRRFLDHTQTLWTLEDRARSLPSPQARTAPGAKAKGSAPRRAPGRQG